MALISMKKGMMKNEKSNQRTEHDMRGYAAIQQLCRAQQPRLQVL